MTKSTIFRPAFLLSISTALIGAALKITHTPGASIFLTITLLLSIVYVIAALYEIYGSTRIGINEKIMWTIGFILFCMLTAILYFLFSRNRIVRDYKILHTQDLHSRL